MNKKWFIAGFLGLAVVGGVGIWGYIKARNLQMQKLFKEVKASVSDVKNIRIEDGALKFVISVRFDNPTAEDFELSSGGAVALKVYRVKVGNDLLTHGNFGTIWGIKLLAGNHLILRNITVEIPLFNLGKYLTQLLGKGDSFNGLNIIIDSIFTGNFDTVKKSFKEIDLKKIITQLSFEVDIDAFGQIFQIKQNLKT